jgi:ornithine carbamoyltransferase
MRHVVTLDDLTTDEIVRILEITDDLKSKFLRGIREPLLAGRVLAILFEKQSLRTRVSFEAGMMHLGGGSLMLGQDVGFGSRESVADFARVLGGMVDVIVVRANRHATAETLAANAPCPVINGLTDRAHPCQALADVYSLRERLGDLRGKTLAWLGDGNNVAASLARACRHMGMRFVVCTPPNYELDLAEFNLQHDAAMSDSFELHHTNDPKDAVRGAAAVYTDVWASMGQEAEREIRKAHFADYQVNAELMSHAPADALFLHCLPAHRGEEVTDDVIDGPNSVVLQQANNRMHVQKGILAWLLGAVE